MVKVPISMLPDKKVVHRFDGDPLWDVERVRGYVWVPYHSVQGCYKTKEDKHKRSTLVFVLNFFEATKEGNEFMVPMKD